MTKQDFVSNLGNCDLFEIWCLKFGAFPYHALCFVLFKDLSWVHDSIGIYQFLDLFHQEKAFPMLFLHKLSFANPNAMFSCGGSTTSQCKMHNLLRCFLNLLPLDLFFRNPHNLHVEISVSGMAEGISLQSFLLDDLLTPFHHIRIF